jgi:hypothetical protein
MPSRTLNFSRKPIRFLAAGLAAVLIGGGTFGIVSAVTGGGSSAAATAAATTTHAGGSNARSGPAAGGSVGKVSALSPSGFTLVTSAGQTVTVKETSSTTYKKGSSAASMSAVARGATVLVLGTANSTTITASQVIVQPPNSGAKGSPQAVPFKPGAPSTSKSVGQIPSSYKQGSGTIVGGATAAKATEAALSAYPGGIVDRVVRLSNGEYEVHNIGVNWPHHVFVSAGFKVVGAG